MNDSITELLKIKYPIIQAGMVWVSGGKLAGACSNAGVLGTIGAGSMKPELLKEHIQKAKQLTQNPLAVNIPLLYKDADKQINTALEQGIKIFITSAGSPKKFTTFLKDNECKVLHVCAHPTLAKKCEDAGVDAVIAEGFEAGGHNGIDELTTMVLIPAVKKSVQIPVIAAGGIACGRSMLAAMSLGANGVQIGSRFVMALESSAHQNYKKELIKSHYSSTKLMMKKTVPVRLLENNFSKKVQDLESICASKEEFIQLLGKGRAKKGMLEGDLIEGELEIGQVCGSFEKIESAKTIVDEIVLAYHKSLSEIQTFN